MSFGDAMNQGGSDYGRSGGRGGSARGGGSGLDGGSSEFSSQANIARSNIQQLLTNISTITRLSSALGGAKDTVDLRERLHRLIEESKLLSVDTKEVVKELGNIATGGYQGGGTGNQRQRIEARKLSDEFTKSLQRFQEVVRSTLSKERESVAKAKRISGHDAVGVDDEQRRLLERERDIEFMQVENDLQFSEALIVEREQGIRDIEKSVHDVNDIFRDLAVLIGDQGGMLDDIEAGIVNTAEHTTTANNELKKAAANQKKARRTMCCLVTVLILVGTLIVLVLTKAI